MNQVKSTPPNLRTVLGFDGTYEAINREERNLAAILYHLLMNPKNLERMLALVSSRQVPSPDETGVFFEYAYVRDLWSTQVRNAETARRCVLQFLSPPEALGLEQMSVLNFNRFFGVGGRPSSTEIQMPARWSISKFKDTITDDDLFLRVCKFKWAFNAKPDIVIHTSRDSAVCIETKLESGEGSYPSSGADREEFKRRGLPLVGQTALQEFVLRDLLGLETEFVFLVQKKNANSPTHRTLYWHDVFSALDCSGAPPFVQRWVARFGKN